MDIADFVNDLKEDEGYEGQIVVVRKIRAQRAVYQDPIQPVAPALKKEMARRGIEKLYCHQAEAVDRVRAGKNLVVVTGTASGKSLCYHIPTLEAILKDRKNCSLYLFPTKALAQDQLRMISEFRLASLKAAAYDGDTPNDERYWVRANANLVLSNPDMLHFGILPHHSRWGNFFLNLKYVVIDELHSLRGVFGSNVANVIRRLRRICSFYGSDPQFILSSATIANPKELAEKLIGLPVELVDRDGSPRGIKYFVLWNPPYLDPTCEKRKSSNSEATYLFSRLARFGLRNITFSRSRQTAELVFRYAREELKDQPELLDKISSYRGGYLAPERRNIEKRLFSGDLLGVSSTNALELGIDVGSLDACVINGFPGTIASTWQQAGRAGRTLRSSLAVLVGQDNPLDQYYMSHPKLFFGKPHEEAIIDFTIPSILEKHLLCTSFEVPLNQSDVKFFGDAFGQSVKNLVAEGRLAERKGRWYFSNHGFPSESVNIRSASSNSYSIVEIETGTILGTVDTAMAFIYLHPGAIYLHRGDSYLVCQLDLQDKIAFVEAASRDYYTQPRDNTTIKILQEKKERALGATIIYWGSVDTTTKVTAFQRRRVLTGEILGIEELDLPEQQFKTDAFWFTLPETVLDKLELEDRELAGGIHAVEHGAIALLPVYAMCDRWDIGGVSTPFHPQTGSPTIFVYDGYEGGIGITSRGFDFAKQLLGSTLKLINHCGCKEGCPSCIQSPKCGNWNEPLDKKAAVQILGAIL
jgi:DEAD/DEAH box helicase domain-containing protein